MSIGLQTADRGLLGGTDVLITYVVASSVLGTLVRPGERLVSVNGEAVTDAKQAGALLTAASQLRLRVVTPAGLEEVGGDNCGLDELRRRRRSVRAERMRQLLVMLRIERTAVADDPLDACESDDDPLLGLLIGGGTDGAGEGAEEEDDEEDEEEAGGDGDGENGVGGANGGAADADDGVIRELRRHCLIASNAWAARRQLQTLASTLEETLQTSAEQTSIVSQSFVHVFGALRKATDEQMSTLAAALLPPVRAQISRLGGLVTGAPRGRAAAAEGSRPLGAEYSRTLGRLRRWLAPEAVQRLLQRLWTDALLELTKALQQQLYAPRELGDAFVRGATELLRELAAVLRDTRDGPKREWLRRRATPLHATLALVELPTAALLQQYRIQPTGPTRAAPLVALALRMDDREAAECIAESQPAELAEGAPLVVDGSKALEKYRELEALV